MRHLDAQSQLRIGLSVLDNTCCHLHACYGGCYFVVSNEPCLIYDLYQEAGPPGGGNLQRSAKGTAKATKSLKIS